MVEISGINNVKTEVSITSYINPNVFGQVSKVIIIPLFAKLEDVKPFEDALCSFFAKKGLQSIGSLSLLSTSESYSTNVITSKFNESGVDAVMILKVSSISAGSTQSKISLPSNAYSLTEGYGSFWDWGGNVNKSGQWLNNQSVYLSAYLYLLKESGKLQWFAEIKIDNPQTAEQSAVVIAKKMYKDLKENALIKK